MIFKVSEQPISPADLYAQVLQDHNGAVVTFCGVVRNHANNKPTRYLVYEAYPEMAERTMAEIGEQIAAKWSVEDVGILHRVGRLEIGEISVLIAVSSPHRAQAFEACRYAIDRLKEVVPIWKKEVGENGEEWVEGPGAGAPKG
ncbi:MAG: molybdenum cofactor biosynthesis protein MoaE [Candidatus Latescibacteria bacterium]|nr:molybdenum cofactor biosynthesis protein MoaE [Candidatus Latescibacterota bacterium]